MFTFPLAATDTQVDRFQRLLSGPENERADRFQFPILKRRFAIGHGVLRILLGRYLQCEPKAIAYSYGPHGKPALAGPSRLRFNMAHSDDKAIFAFALDCEVGVDIERLRPIAEAHAIAAQHFSPADASQLRALSPDRQTPAFFRCWTCKEAYGKAAGLGLSVPPGEVPPRFLADAEPSIISDESKQWRVQSLSLRDGYAGAIAYGGNIARPVILLDPVSSEDLAGF